MSGRSTTRKNALVMAFWRVADGIRFSASEQRRHSPKTNGTPSVLAANISAGGAGSLQCGQVFNIDQA
jgi:hypothetical protein